MTDWLSLARDSFNSSTSYIDANYRRQIEDNINMFNSKHVSNSKYHSDSYKHRSRLFRPKSRSTVRKNEALAASAYFSNIDVVNIDAEMQSDPAQLASASINKELLQYRLTKTIPWFQLLIGAFQQAQVDGVVCSYQDWDYREKTTKRTVDNGFGEEVEIEDVKVLSDKPVVKLVPFENIRFDPSSDWVDVVGTSPYLIEMLPMYAADVKLAMNTNDPKTGQPKFKKLSDEDIRVAVNATADTTRS